MIATRSQGVELACGDDYAQYAEGAVFSNVIIVESSVGMSDVNSANLAVI